MNSCFLFIFFYFIFLFSPSSEDTESEGFGDAMIVIYIMLPFIVLVLCFSCFLMWALACRGGSHSEQAGLGCCDMERRKERVKEDVEQWSKEQFGTR